jgi:CheY-like chemotaxis protein
MHSYRFLKLKILVAEDNPMNQRIMALMLKNLGHVVDVVSNGIEALLAIELQEYDLVLMDVMMPEMDGIEATRTIRRLWPNGPKIIVVTASGIYRESCLNAGADDFVVKPVKMDELNAAIERNICGVPAVVVP